LKSSGKAIVVVGKTTFQTRVLLFAAQLHFLFSCDFNQIVCDSSRCTVLKLWRKINTIFCCYISKNTCDGREFDFACRFAAVWAASGQLQQVYSREVIMGPRVAYPNTFDILIQRTMG